MDLGFIKIFVLNYPASLTWFLWGEALISLITFCNVAVNSITCRQVKLCVVDNLNTFGDSDALKYNISSRRSTETLVRTAQARRSNSEHERAQAHGFHWRMLCGGFIGSLCSKELPAHQARARTPDVHARPVG